MCIRATECAAFLVADPLRDCRATLELELHAHDKHAGGRHVILCGTPAGRAIAIRRCHQLAAEGTRGLVVHIHPEGRQQLALIFDPDGGAPQSVGFDAATDRGREALLTFLADLEIRSLEIAEPSRIPDVCLAQLTQRFAYDLLIIDTTLGRQRAIGSGVDPDWSSLIAGARRVSAIDQRGADFAEAAIGLRTARLCAPPARPTRHRTVSGPPRPGVLALHANAAEFRFIRALSDQMANADEDVEIIVLGSTLDDLKLMQRTNVMITGDPIADDVATLIDGHGITHLILDLGEPLFGHPLVDALLATGLPVAATEWIPAGGGRTANLGLRPDFGAAETIASVCDWLIEDPLLHPDWRNVRDRRQVGARLP